MPRPTNQTELLERAEAMYDRLMGEIDGLSLDTIVAGDTVGEWSIKDVIAHLYAWQQMTVRWYQAGEAGENPVTPSEEYTWREIPALNQHIYETYKNVEWDTILSDFKTSHQDTLSLIKMLDNDELFTPQVYNWTRSTTVGAYFISATSSHYDWARKEIRRGLKAKSTA